MISRLLNPLMSNSFFLFGARATGKTTLLQAILPAENTYVLDLLNPEEEERFAGRPVLLEELALGLGPEVEWIVVDEVQKVPRLLDVVHSLIEKTSLKFALTGSSARKLRRGAANLLAGRAFVYELYPLTSRELGERFQLSDALAWGTLPKLLDYSTDQEKIEYLSAYGRTYLKEEVWTEQLVRSLDPFRLFLEIAAQMDGEIINFSKIAREVGVDPKTIRAYFEILEDTLLGSMLYPFERSIRKRQRKAPKFYFFDTGIQRALTKTLTVAVNERSYGYGKLFERFIVNEIFRLNSYQRRQYRFSYFQGQGNTEIDLVVERPGMPLALVEIKSSAEVDITRISTLERLASDFGKCEVMCLSREKQTRKIGSVTVYPWQKGLEALGL